MANLSSAMQQQMMGLSTAHQMQYILLSEQTLLQTTSFGGDIQLHFGNFSVN